MSTKGSINTETVGTSQGFRWLHEVIDKARDDALNIKKEDYDAVKQLLNRFEKSTKGFELVEDTLTANQWKKLWGKL